MRELLCDQIDVMNTHIDVRIAAICLGCVQTQAHAAAAFANVQDIARLESVGCDDVEQSLSAALAVLQACPFCPSRIPACLCRSFVLLPIVLPKPGLQYWLGPQPRSLLAKVKLSLRKGGTVSAEWSKQGLQ